MANTLTSLYPKIFAALNVVSREMTGMIPAVSRSASIERVAKGESDYRPRSHRRCPARASCRATSRRLEPIAMLATSR